MGVKKQVHFRHVPHEADIWTIPANRGKTHEQIALERASAWAAENGMAVISYTVVIKDYGGGTEDDIPEEILFVLRPIADAP